MKYLIIFSLLFYSLFIPNIYAQESELMQVDNELIATESAEKNVEQSDEEYALPYPGILPDNPLYPLKAFRDRVVGFLISDSLKLAEFNLLQADKRLQAGVFLIEKNKKFDLAEETISKGENYFEYAITNTQDAEKQGKDLGAIKDKLRKSIRKHKKVITDLIKISPKEQEKSFKELLKRVTNIEQKVKALKK